MSRNDDLSWNGSANVFGAPGRCGRFGGVGNQLNIDPNQDLIYFICQRPMMAGISERKKIDHILIRKNEELHFSTER